MSNVINPYMSTHMLVIKHGHRQAEQDGRSRAKKIGNKPFLSFLKTMQSRIAQSKKKCTKNLKNTQK